MSGRKHEDELTDVEPLKGFDDFDLCLGDIMRGERATLGKSLLDVQRELKIKASYIAAIENADPSAFESPGFVAGYVRSYARYLGLDPEWAFQTFCEEGNFAHSGKIGGSSKKSALANVTKPDSMSGIRDPFKQPTVKFIPAGEGRFTGIEPGAVGSVGILAALIAAIGYGGWSILQEVQKVQFTPVDQTPGVLSQLDPVRSVPAGEGGEAAATEVAGLAPAPTTEAFDRLYRPQALDVPVLTSRDSPIATIQPGSLGTLAPDAQGVERRPERVAQPSLAPIDIAVAEALGGLEQALAEAADPAAASVPPTSVQVVGDQPPEVTLFAVRPSWVRLRGADGTIVFEKILDAGETFVLPQTEEAHTLRAGNAGSVYFTVGDKTYGPAGPGASVAKDVVVSAEALPQAYEIADIDADADLARFVAVAEAQSE